MRVVLSGSETRTPSQSLPACGWLVVLSARAVRASLPQLNPLWYGAKHLRVTRLAPTETASGSNAGALSNKEKL
jgi:hypothetical protein